MVIGLSWVLTSVFTLHCCLFNLTIVEFFTFYQVFVREIWEMASYTTIYCVDTECFIYTLNIFNFETTVPLREKHWRKVAGSLFHKNDYLKFEVTWLHNLFISKFFRVFTGCVRVSHIIYTYSCSARRDASNGTTFDIFWENRKMSENFSKYRKVSFHFQWANTVFSEQNYFFSQIQLFLSKSCSAQREESNATIFN